MKRTSTVFTAVLPYLYFTGFACMYLFDWDSDLVLFGFFAAFFVLSIASAVLYAYLGNIRNMLWIKLSAVPADISALSFIVIRTAENLKALQNGALGVGLSIFVLILFCIPYLLSRSAIMISGAVVCARGLGGKKPLHIFLHLLPVADIVSAALLHKSLPDA